MVQRWWFVDSLGLQSTVTQEILVMEAKDADLATDYADIGAYLVGQLTANFEALEIPGELFALEELYLVDLGKFVTSVVYRMRAYDTTLESIVFWNSSTPDEDSSDYQGPGPVINIVVRSVSGD